LSGKKIQNLRGGTAFGIEGKRRSCGGKKKPGAWNEQGTADSSKMTKEKSRPRRNWNVKEHKKKTGVDGLTIIGQKSVA